MHVNRKNIVLFFLIVFILFLLYFIYTIRTPLLDVMKPVFIALLISYIFNPVVDFLEEKRLSRAAAILIIYSILITVLIIILVFFIPKLMHSIRELIQTIPDYFERYVILFNELIIRYKHSGIPEPAREILDSYMNNSKQIIINTLQSFVRYVPGIFSLIIDTILGAVIAFYIMKDIELFKKTVLSLIPKNCREWFAGFAMDIDTILSGFIRGQLLIAAILSILTAAGLWMIGVKYAMLLGIIAGLMDVIPYFGPILSAVPAIIIALIEKPVNVVWVILLYFLIQQIEGSILSPRIIGSRVGLHPAITIVVVLIAAKFFGLLGMLLAVPIAAIIKVLTRRLVQIIV